MERLLSVFPALAEERVYILHWKVFEFLNKIKYDHMFQMLLH